MKYITLLMLAGLLAQSCKKDYDCVCTNSNGSYDAGTIKNTKHKAKQYCSDLNAGSTTCTLK